MSNKQLHNFIHRNMREKGKGKKFRRKRESSEWLRRESTLVP